MTTLLSSRSTPFHKFVVPVLVTAALAFAVWNGTMRPGSMHLPPGMTADQGVLLLVAIACLTAVILFVMLAPLKRVELADDELIISNYRTEIRVPLELVESIDVQRLANPKRCTIRFSEPTDFGRRVVFMAPMQMGLNRFAEPAAVTELKRAWAEARAKARG